MLKYPSSVQTCSFSILLSIHAAYSGAVHRDRATIDCLGPDRLVEATVEQGGTHNYPMSSNLDKWRCLPNALSKDALRTGSVWYGLTVGRLEATLCVSTWKGLSSTANRWGKCVECFLSSFWISSQLSLGELVLPKGFPLCLPHGWAFTHSWGMLNFHTGSPRRSIKLQNCLIKDKELKKKGRTKLGKMNLLSTYQVSDICWAL